MNAFTQWLIIALTIIIVPLVMPGTGIAHPLTAFSLAAAFAGIALVIEPFLEYARVPLTRLNLFIFFALMNGALLLWAVVAAPGMYVSSLAAGFLVATALSMSHAHIVFHSDSFDRAIESLRKQARALAARFASIPRPDPTASKPIEEGMTVPVRVV